MDICVRRAGGVSHAIDCVGGHSLATDTMIVTPLNRRRPVQHAAGRALGMLVSIDRIAARTPALL
ncbi:MAG: hypothetical protein ACHQ9S_10970 [Candidatus Binatia bacterium]